MPDHRNMLFRRLRRIPVPPYDELVRTILPFSVVFGSLLDLRGQRCCNPIATLIDRNGG